MKTSSKGVAFVAAHEGVVTRAYRDSAGVWTIGVGHTAAAGAPFPKRGMVITRAEAMAILARDLPRYERRVEAAMGRNPQPVGDGSVSFDFNTGAIDAAAWVRSYRAGDLPAAKAELMRWTKAGGRTLAGLVRRRSDERDLIFAGQYGAIDESVIGTAAAPSASQTGDEVREYQRQLASLGYYRAPADGIAGAETRAAVLAYQEDHPDLVADGIVGPATRASLVRDLAARQQAGGAVIAATAGAATGAITAAEAGSGHPVLFAILAGAGVLALAVGFLAWRYGGELRRLLHLSKKGT